MTRNRKSPILLLFVLGAAAVVLFGAFDVEASNMGFKKNFTYTRNTPVSNEHWISLPYFYDPRAMMGASNLCTPTVVDAEDLAYNLNRGTATTNVTFVAAKNLATGAIDQYTVGGYCDFAFQLEEGRGYQITINASGASPVSMSLVGSHDDAAAIPFTVGGNPTNEFWISVPYHFMRPGADSCTNASLNASDISNSFPAGRVGFVSAMNETTGAIDQYTVGGYCDFAFNLVTGQGYQVTLQGAAGGITWSPSHY